MMYVLILIFSLSAFAEIWVSDCRIPESDVLRSKVFFSLNEAEAKMTIKTYYGNECREDRVVFQDEARADVDCREDDMFCYSVSALEHVVLDQNLALIYKLKQPCEIKHWELGVPSDVSGTACNVFGFNKGDSGKTMILIKGQKLLFDGVIELRLLSKE